MCLIRTYEDDYDYIPARRVHVHRHRSPSPPPTIGLRRRIARSPSIRSLRSRFSRVSFDDSIRSSRHHHHDHHHHAHHHHHHRPRSIVTETRRVSVPSSPAIIFPPRPPSPPVAVEVVRGSDIGSSTTSGSGSSGSSSSSSSSTSGTRVISVGTGSVRSPSRIRGEKDYLVRETTTKVKAAPAPRGRQWSPVRLNVDTERSRSRGRGEWYVEEGDGVFRKDRERSRSARYW
ncbi:MAG: hypothetical protein M1820_006526 [Bogoriella megaspora]|nr:MAG: hypothetical protein M1820_006526 [Bogoriella megaspora]